jgi:hypothetical protein
MNPCPCGHRLIAESN